jgi:hypothetical protein
MVIQFDKPTSMPLVATKDDILRFLHFTVDLGAQLRGQWRSSSELRVVVLDDTGQSPPEAMAGFALSVKTPDEPPPASASASAAGSEPSAARAAAGEAGGADADEAAAAAAAAAAASERAGDTTGARTLRLGEAGVWYFRLFAASPASEGPAILGRAPLARAGPVRVGLCAEEALVHSLRAAGPGSAPPLPSADALRPAAAALREEPAAAAAAARALGALILAPVPHYVARGVLAMDGRRALTLPHSLLPNQWRGRLPPAAAPGVVSSGPHTAAGAGAGVWAGADGGPLAGAVEQPSAAAGAADSVLTAPLPPAQDSDSHSDSDSDSQHGGGGRERGRRRRAPPSSGGGPAPPGGPMADVGSWTLSFWVFLPDEGDGVAHRTLFYKGLGGDERTPSVWLLPSSRRMSIQVSARRPGAD